MTALPADAGPARLRRFRAADLEAFQAYRRDPEVGRYQSWARMDDREAAGFISAVAADPFVPKGAWTQIAIARAATDELIGDIGIHLDADGGEAEIGFTLAREAQGRGFAAFAATRVLELLFEKTEAMRVIGVADAENAPSLALMTRIGMIETRREPAIFNGAPCIEATFEARRGVWRGVAF